MPYQYKREPLSNDEVNRITNACDTFREKFVVWTLLDIGLRLSEFADLKKDNIQWQERRLVIYGKGRPYGKKTKRRIISMTERVRRLMHSAIVYYKAPVFCSRQYYSLSFPPVFSKVPFSAPKTPEYDDLSSCPTLYTPKLNAPSKTLLQTICDYLFLFFFKIA